MTSEQLSVEPVGDMIVARLRGEPTETLLRQCQERVVELTRGTGRGKILYDAREMDVPPVDVALAQEKLDAVHDSAAWRRAIVVPNTRLAYLARLAFGEGNYRVFYNDLSAAATWLKDDSRAP